MYILYIYKNIINYKNIFTFIIGGPSLPQDHPVSKHNTTQYTQWIMCLLKVRQNKPFWVKKRLCHSGQETVGISVDRGSKKQQRVGGETHTTVPRGGLVCDMCVVLPHQRWWGRADSLTGSGGSGRGTCTSGAAPPEVVNKEHIVPGRILVKVGSLWYQVISLSIYPKIELEWTSNQTKFSSKCKCENVCFLYNEQSSKMLWNRGWLLRLLMLSGRLQKILVM